MKTIQKVSYWEVSQISHISSLGFCVSSCLFRWRGIHPFLEKSRCYRKSDLIFRIDISILTVRHDVCGIFHAFLDGFWSVSWRPLEQCWSNLGRSETKKIQGRLFYHQFSARGGETGVVAGRERGPALPSHPSKGRKKVSEIFNEIRLGRWMVSVFMDYPQQDAKDFPHRMKLFSKVLNFMLNLIFRRIGPSRHFSKNFFGLPIT